MSLEVVQVVFSLALIQYFLIVFPFLPFEMVMYILCHYVFELCNLFYHFNFIEVMVKRLFSLERDFGLLSKFSVFNCHREWGLFK